MSLKIEKTLPSPEVSVKFKSNEYTIKFPTTGQFIDIELMKASLSSNQYVALFNSTRSAEWARLYIDCVSTLNILVPTLLKDLNTSSILNLSMTDSIELVKEFKKIYVPWYNDWMTVLTSTDEEDEQE